MKEKGSAIDFNFLRPREPEEMLSEGYDTVAIADFSLPASYSRWKTLCSRSCPACQKRPSVVILLRVVRA